MQNTTVFWVIFSFIFSVFACQQKISRSEPYDFQRGEVKWNGGNLYFDQWSWRIDVTYQ